LKTSFHPQYRRDAVVVTKVRISFMLNFYFFFRQEKDSNQLAMENHRERLEF